MIIDAHVHAFPHFGGASGHVDAKTHLMMHQGTIKKFWGRMVSNTMDPKYIPRLDENVNFKVGNYGKFIWTSSGENAGCKDSR